MVGLSFGRCSFPVSSAESCTQQSQTKVPRVSLCPLIPAWVGSGSSFSSPSQQRQGSAAVGSVHPHSGVFGEIKTFPSEIQHFLQRGKSDRGHQQLCLSWGSQPTGGDWSCPVPVQSRQPRWPLGTLGLCFAECQYLRILQREVCSRLQKPIQGTIRQEESVFFNEFQELVSKADPGGETGGKSVVTALEGRRILAQNWAEAEGLAPWFWGCSSSCSEL